MRTITDAQVRESVQRLTLRIRDKTVEGDVTDDFATLMLWVMQELKHRKQTRAATLQELAEWAFERWYAEVASRPSQNVHRRALDVVWRQVIRRCGGDGLKLENPGLTTDERTKMESISPNLVKELWDGDQTGMTAEEADRTYDEAEAVPISDERIEELLQYVRNKNSDTITAEWCVQNGAVKDTERAFFRWHRGGHIIDWDFRGWVWINRRKSARLYNRRQLLTLLTALRGE